MQYNIYEDYKVAKNCLWNVWWIIFIWNYKHKDKNLINLDSMWSLVFRKTLEIYFLRKIQLHTEIEVFMIPVLDQVQWYLSEGRGEAEK